MNRGTAITFFGDNICNSRIKYDDDHDKWVCIMCDCTLDKDVKFYFYLKFFTVTTGEFWDPGIGDLTHMEYTEESMTTVKQFLDSLTFTNNLEDHG